MLEVLQTLDEELTGTQFDGSLASDLFEAKRSREFICNTCRKIVALDAESRTTIHTLPLPESEEDSLKEYTCTLHDCLLLSRDMLGPYQCFNCSSVCEQRIAVKKFPQILCFHFNRSRWTGKVINRATRSGAKGKN